MYGVQIHVAHPQCVNVPSLAPVPVPVPGLDYALVLSRVHALRAPCLVCHFPVTFIEAVVRYAYLTFLSLQDHRSPPLS